jgi:hypothetical protein
MRKIVISELKENLEYQEKYKLAHWMNNNIWNLIL